MVCFSSMDYSNNSTENLYSPLDIEDNNSRLHDIVSSNTRILQSRSIYDLLSSLSPPTIPHSIQNEHNFQADDDILFEIDFELDDKMRYLSPLGNSQLKTTDYLISHLSGLFIYELMAPSNQIIILDNQLTVQSSISILTQTNMSISTIWCKEKGFVYDVLSPMSLLSALSYQYFNDFDSRPPLESLLYELFPFACHSQLVTVPSESTLYNACRILLDNSLLFLPVVNLINQSICFIFSIQDILSVLYSRISSFQTMPVLRLTLKQLNIVPNHVSVLSPSDSMLKVFQNFCNQTSIVPIVSEKGILVNTFTVFDGMRIFAEYPKVNLSTLSITDALIQIFPNKIHFDTCCIEDQMIRIFSIFHRAKAFSLIVINESGYPFGIICLLDILKKFFLFSN